MADKTLLDKTDLIERTVQTENSSPEQVRVVTEQDVDPVITYAREMSDQTFSDDMKPVAEIPMVIVEKMMQDGSWGDAAAMKKWLNDPANRVFRIWQGKV